MSADSPAISVIVPFFNSGQFIERCIEGLLAQEDVPAGSFELIFIDNKSEDDSRAIVERYPAITLLDEETPGAYAARNTGVAQASAPIIAFTDADCVVDRRWMRSILDRMEDPTVGALVGRCKYPAQASWGLQILGAYENAKTDYVLTKGSPEQRYAYANNMAVRASILKDLGPFIEWRRAGDSEFVHRMIQKRPDLEIVYCRQVTVTHLEFESCRKRVRRLTLYTKTNSKIETFRELKMTQRLTVLGRVLRGAGK